MKLFVTTALCAGMLTWTAPAPVQAGVGVIDRACRQSNRAAATPALCRCIQRVANDSLSRSERRKVAKWFKDPQKAQATRQSNRRGAETLWERYKAFGERAARVCAPG